MPSGEVVWRNAETRVAHGHESSAGGRYDGGVVDRPPPERQPGEVRPPVSSGHLDHPPSQRYLQAAPGPDSPGGVPRAVAAALGVGALGATAIAGLGEVVGIGAGLVAVAALIGWLVAASLRMAGPALGRRPRQTLAIAIALAAVVVGQVGLWLISTSEGSVVDPLTYLGAVFGFLVPAELVVAAAVAWRTAR
jgi:hypothetical protein